MSESITTHQLISGTPGVKMGGGVLSKAASQEAVSMAGKAASSRANEDMWMKQLGRHGEEAAARERAEGDTDEEEEKGTVVEVEVRIVIQ